MDQGRICGFSRQFPVLKSYIILLYVTMYVMSCHVMLCYVMLCYGTTVVYVVRR